jgi:hypothetical protein
MQQLISKFNRNSKTGNLELEIRSPKYPAYMYPDICKSFNAKGDPEMSFSILINKFNFTKIMVRKVNSTIFGLEKMSLTRPIEIGPFVVHLEKENKTVASEVRDSDIIHYKYRRSIKREPWKIDITLVSESSVLVARENPELKNFIIQLGTGNTDNLETYNLIKFYVSVEAEYLQNVIDERVLNDQIIYMSKSLSEFGTVAPEVIDFETKKVTLLSYIYGQSSLKKTLNNPVSLSFSEYLNIYPPIHWFVTDKADGVRALTFISDIGITILTETDIYGPMIKKYQLKYVFDSEYMDQISRTFDTLYSKDVENIMNKSGMVRIAELQKFKSNRVIPKNYRQIKTEGDIEKICQETLDRPYPIDGIIFMEPNRTYYTTRNYKWKPIDKETIDFLMVLIPEKYQDAPSKYSYFLLSHYGPGQLEEYCIEIHPILKEIAPDLISNNCQFMCPYKVRPYLFESPDPKLDRCVVEFRYDTNWIPVKKRTDKTFGNNILVARATFSDYIAPFELKYLWDPISADQYFEKKVSKKWKESNQYRRFILTSIFMNELGPGILYDLGGGREADFLKYVISGVTKVINLDNDSMALAESLSRTKIKIPKTLTNWLKVLNMVPRTTCTEYYAFKFDIRNAKVPDYVSMTDTFGQGKYIVSTFSLHYFDIETVFEGLTKLIGHGKFIATILDGAAVQKKLDENGGDWQADIYHIKYGKDRNNIEIAVPFSDSLYNEALVFIDNIIKIGNRYGFSSAKIMPFSDPIYAKLYEKEKEPSMIEYTNLFTSIIFLK